MANKKNKDSPFLALQGLKKDLATEEERKARDERERARKAQEAQRLAREKARGGVTDDEQALWQNAVSGVRPIDRSGPLPVTAGRRNPAPFGEDEDAEVLRELRDLVAGKGTLDFSFSDEFVEGRAWDCSHQHLTKLKQGEFAVQGHLDLHGMNREDARESLLGFFSDSLKRGNRCVLVIPGRGLGSPGGKPVLKALLVRWLVQGQLSRYVLAFSSAQAHDGGVGALYVLLRRSLSEAHAFKTR